MTDAPAGRARPSLRQRARRLTDLQTFGLITAAGALVIPHVPDPGILCPLRRLTGVPCPMCGSTTAVLYLSQGHPMAALAANPAAVVLAVFCVGAFLPPRWRLRLARQVGAWRLRISSRAQLAVSVAVPAALWVYQLHRFGRW